MIGPGPKRLRYPGAQRLLVTVGVALGMVMVGACGEDEGPELKPVDQAAALAKQKAQAKAQAQAAAPPAPPEKVEVYAYSPVGKRDPFRSYLAELASQRQQEARPTQATELYELDQYRLTGLITGTSQPKAMVEDPEGKGHTLKVGSRVGKNAGRVTRISAKGIVVVEEFVNPVGKRVRVPITLKLREDTELLIITE